MDADRRKRQSFHLVVASLFRDGLPKALEQMERAHSDAGQAVVWLVGIASTLLVLAVANPEKVSAVAAHNYGLLCGLLLTTIAAGVLCRLVALWALAFGRGIMFHLAAHMAGHVEGWGLEPPDELSSRWDRQEIVRRIREDFGQDYGFLLKHNAPLEACQECYQGVHDSWQQHQAKYLGRLREVIGAHFALTEAKTKQLFDSSEDLRSIRTEAYLFKGMSVVAGLLMVLSAATFLGAMYVVARGLGGFVSP